MKDGGGHQSPKMTVEVVAALQKNSLSLAQSLLCSFLHSKCINIQGPAQLRNLHQYPISHHAGSPVRMIN